MKISEKRLRQLVLEEIALKENIDHASIKDVVSRASELLSAIADFKEEAPPAILNAALQHLSGLEKMLEQMVSNPGSYVNVPKKEPKKVTLRKIEDTDIIKKK